MPDSQIQHNLVEMGLGKYRITVSIDTSLVQSEISGRVVKRGKSPSESSGTTHTDAKYEVINDLIRTTFEDAALTYGLSPASAPSVEVLSDDNDSFVFAAIFEVTPNIDLSKLQAISIKVPVVEVTNEDLEATIASLLSQSPDKEAVFESLGIKNGGEEAFRREVLLNMQREADLCESEIRKQRVMSRLSDTLKVAIPESMVISEVGRLKSASNEADNATLSEPDLRHKATQSLQRRIIISAVAQETHLYLDPKMVRQHIEKIATAYESPQEVIEYYYSNRAELAGIEAKVIEDLVIEWLTEKCQLSSYKISFSDAVNILRQQ